MSGQPLPGSELDALMVRFTAAGDQDAQASLLSAYTGTAFLAGRLDEARDFLRARDALSLPAWPNWPCWRPKERDGGPARWPAPCGRGPGASPAAGPATCPPT
jgi:hypothetical protein